MELDVVTEMEDICLRIGNVPAFGCVRLDNGMLVFPDERTEHYLEKPFRAGIDSDSGIEICGRLVQSNREHACFIGGRKARATRQTCSKDNQEQRPLGHR